MKLSQYISVITLGQKYTLIYCATSDSFLCCRKDEWESFESNQEEGCELFHTLKKIGAVIDDDCNEVELIRNKMNQNDLIESEVHLHINPTLNCNFNCWYCYENHLPKSRMDGNTLSSIIKTYEQEVIQS